MVSAVAVDWLGVAINSLLKNGAEVLEEKTRGWR